MTTDKLNGDAQTVLVHKSRLRRHDDQEEKNSYFLATDDVSLAPRSSSITDRVSSMCGCVVNNTKFKNFMLALIVANSACMGLATFDFVTDNPSMGGKFDGVDLAFQIIFTVEIMMQLMHLGLALFNDGWLVFDFVVVIGSWIFVKMKIFRSLRILRAFRLVSMFGDMRIIVEALVSVIPKLGAIGGLLFLIFYIFAVMFTSLFKYMYSDGLTSDNYFSRLDVSFFTLFQMMTLDGWAEITREVMATYYWAWVLCIIFVLISSLTVINLIVAVLCDAVGQAQRGQMKQELIEFKDSFSPSISSSKSIRDTEDRLDRIDQRLANLTDTVVQLLEMNKEIQDSVKYLKGRID